MLSLFTAAALFGASNSLIIDRPDSIVSGWTELKRTDPSQAIKLSFALKNENVDGVSCLCSSLIIQVTVSLCNFVIVLEKTLLDVSTPGNEEYGNHKDVSTLYEMIAPSAEAIDTVQDWLFDNFDADIIFRETPNDDMFSVQTTIAKAEQLLDCQYFDYLSDVDSKTIVSRVKLGTHYNIDAKVGQHLYFATPTHRFPYLQPRLRKSVGAGEVNPTVLRALYNVGDAKGKASNNSQGTTPNIQNSQKPKSWQHTVTVCLGQELHRFATSITSCRIARTSGRNTTLTRAL